MLVGHTDVVSRLSESFPAVSLIQGPSSVGKRLIAAKAAMANSVDRIDFLPVSRLTVDESARIKNFMKTYPSGPLKVASIDIDGATCSAMDKLLVLLENPAPYSRYVLTSSAPVPRTLQTRSEKFFVGYLSEQELTEILLSRGIPQSELSNLVGLGSVQAALQAHSTMPSFYAALNILQAVESQDHILLMQAYKGIDDACARMILTALQESASQRWRLFKPQQLGVFAKRQIATKVLGAWTVVSDARLSLSIRVLLESLMRG